MELFATTHVSKFYTGSHVRLPKVKSQREECFEVKQKKPQLLETDGEVLGVVKAVEFSLLP